MVVEINPDANGAYVNIARVIFARQNVEAFLELLSQIRPRHRFLIVMLHFLRQTCVALVRIAVRQVAHFLLVLVPLFHLVRKIPSPFLFGHNRGRNVT